MAPTDKPLSSSSSSLPAQHTSGVKSNDSSPTQQTRSL
eukprot:CAMPEP_0172455892 /NCGR_PEP_ID=MMETSP1065-20121228/12966_1 /TAXON_ID=265537 /ORGANISM="Amphiprora paludosa, Strain CCMP125" /LENGTH=37 /DNA_ID= /DNA_START= /DNA_END= /DNA_ORIENTATION=